MKKATKPIGLDANFREVFPGDEVRDADGHGYTITAAGWAKPLTGGSEIAFKRLKNPVVVCPAPRVQEGDHTQSAKFAEGPDGKVGPASRLMAAPDIQAAVKAPDRITQMVMEALPAGHEVVDVRDNPYKPGKINITTRPVKAKEPKPSRVGIGGKKNKSGWSKLNAICRTIGVSGQGITGYLRDHGFEVFRAEGTSCVKVEDREKVVAFLRDNPSPVGLPKTSSYDGAVRRIKAEVAAPDSCTVREAGDQMLVDELRARGWTVTCTKTQSL